MNYFQAYPAYSYSSYSYDRYWQNPYYHFNYYPHPIYDSMQPPPIFYPSRNIDDVDVTIFNESLASYKQLMRDASKVLNHLADSKDFATKVMGAAQLSDTKEVERLIHTTGIQANFKVTYNPDGIHLYFWSNVKGTECCKLDMAIRWR